MAAANTELPFWSSQEKGQIGLNGQKIEMHLITGPRGEVMTVLVLPEDRKLIGKVLAALAKAEV